MFTTTTIAAASTNNQLWAVLAIPASAIIGSVATMAFARVNEATDRRRERYAEAVQTLVAWTEFAYRVRRRADNSPGTLSTLANRGHDLQERLAYHQAWIATEHPDLAHAYATTRAIIDHDVGPCVSDAWMNDPILAPSDMNLKGWGPSNASSEAIAKLQNEIANRFGFHRIKTESHVEQLGSLSKEKEATNDNRRLYWQPLSHLHWVVFLLLLIFSLGASHLSSGGFLDAWLLPLTWLGAILGVLALSPWWIRASDAFINLLERRLAWVVSISGTATGSVFVGLAIVAAVASPVFLDNSEETSRIGQLFAAPVTFLIATMALGVYALVSATVYYLCAHAGIKRITSGVAAVSTLLLPILVAVSVHHMLRITLLAFLA